MNRKQAVKYFKVKCGHCNPPFYDKPARAAKWKDYVNTLLNNGYITKHQAQTWKNPFLRD